jgi:hypothetical protein
LHPFCRAAFSGYRKIPAHIDPTPLPTGPTSFKPFEINPSEPNRPVRPSITRSERQVIRSVRPTS